MTHHVNNVYEPSSTENIGFHRNKKLEKKLNKPKKQSRKPNSRKKQKQNKKKTKRKQRANKKNKKKINKQKKLRKMQVLLFLFLVFFSGDSSCRVAFLVIMFLIVFFKCVLCFAKIC